MNPDPNTAPENQQLVQIVQQAFAEADTLTRLNKAAEKSTSFGKLLSRTSRKALAAIFFGTSGIICSAIVFSTIKAFLIAPISGLLGASLGAL